MAHVLDVAKYILERQGRITTLKLQKLVYYVQVWAIAKNGDPLFSDSIKAWASGPVVPLLFQKHKGRRRVIATEIEGTANGLNDAERQQVDEVLAHYGGLPPAYLSKLTHYERPWSEAHETGERLGRKSPTISIDAIRSFYRKKTPEQLEADYQMSVATKLMDEHAESLAYLAR